MKVLITSILFLFSFCVKAQIDKVIPNRPSPPRLVNDFTNNTLTPAQMTALESKVDRYNDSTSSQIAIVIISTLDGYDIAEYGLALGRAWGIGGREFNNGILILVAKNDRKVRIEVGPGLEGAVPDITAKSIIDNSITPSFKEDNYYRGLDRAVDDIIRSAAGEYKAPQGYGKKKKSWSGFGSIIAFLIIMLILGGLGGGGRTSGGTLSGAGWILGSLLSGAGRGGGWSGGGSSSGGGGFSGFGGGSFGGGGASGSW